MFINLTPHEIYETVTGLRIPTTSVARVRQCSREIAVIDGVIYIVSALALNAVPADRTDVVAPGNAVRNELGIVIGCAGFRCR